jgi:hypothetical protein
MAKRAEYLCAKSQVSDSLRASGALLGLLLCVTSSFAKAQEFPQNETNNGSPLTVAEAPPVVQPDPTPVDTHSYRSAPFFNRSYQRGSVLVSEIAGTVSEFGGERSPEGGVWVAGALRIANTLTSYFIPNIRGHLVVGYSARYVAIGLDVGGGLGLTWNGPMGAIEAGLAMRLGSLSGTQLRVLVYWSAYPALLGKIPSGGELSLLVPAGKRSWFELAAIGDYRLGLLGGTLGAQHFLSSTPKGQNFFTWGAGVMHSAPVPGAIFQFGYGHRY